MNISTSCREATKADLEALLHLHRQPALDDGKSLPLRKAERIFDRISRYPDYKIYVAVSDGNVIGTFSLLIMDNLGHVGAPSAIIEDVAVEPNWQNRGIGRMMMAHAMKLCAQKGCYKAALSSNMKRERAHAFYESLGFERHGYSFRIDVRSDAMPGTKESLEGHQQ